MKRTLNKLIAVGIILAMLAGCATIKNDATRTTTEGTLAGTGVGIATGAIVGALVGGKKGAAIGAGIGGVIGAGAGYAIGRTVADRKQKYANEEDRLKGEIKVVAQYNQELGNYNLQTAERIKTLDKEISNLKSQYKARRVKEIALKNKQGDINKLIIEADKIKDDKSKELIALNEYRKSINETQSQADVAKLDQEVSVLKKGIAMVDINKIQMAQQFESLTVRR